MSLQSCLWGGSRGEGKAEIGGGMGTGGGDCLLVYGQGQLWGKCRM